MTDSEIKEMLKDIIDNGAEYEFRWLRTDGWSDWKTYRLGEEILCNDSRYEYRKVEWYVIGNEKDGYRSTNEKCANIKQFRGTKEECEKWMQEHAIEWHDLRKCPDDLPKETKDYIIYHEDNTGFHHYSIRRFSHNEKVNFSTVRKYPNFLSNSFCNC